MKALKITGAAVAVIIVVFALLLVIGIPSGFLKSAIQDRVEHQTGYRLTIAGSTKVGLWPTLNISLGDLTLQDPKDRDGTSRITIDNAEADVTLSSLWSGHPHVSELVITRPVIYRPLLRERTRDVPARTTKPASDADGGTIERVIGTLIGQCHLLPGTTKNSVRAKGDYDSKKHAAMTLRQIAAGAFSRPPS